MDAKDDRDDKDRAAPAGGQPVNPFAGFGGASAPQPTADTQSAGSESAAARGTGQNPFGRFEGTAAASSTGPAAQAPAGARDPSTGASPFGKVHTPSLAVPAQPSAAQAEAPSLSLDLGAPTPAPSQPPSTPASPPPAGAPDLGSLSLDLDAPAPAAPTAASLAVPSLSLDRDSAPVPTTAVAPAAPARRYPPLPDSLNGFPRLPAGSTHIPGRDMPDVAALSRIQSGVGLLRFSLDTPSTGLTLGCVYETTAGVTAVARRGDTAPNPLLALSPSGHVLLNLRKVRALRRFLVYVSAKNPQSVWAGVGAAALADGARLHFPVEYPTAHESMVMCTGYAVDGQIVLRAEQDHQDVPLRTLCEAYGFTRLAWRDDRNVAA